MAMLGVAVYLNSMILHFLTKEEEITLLSSLYRSLTILQPRFGSLIMISDCSESW